MKILIESCMIYFSNGKKEKIAMQENVQVDSIPQYKRDLKELIANIDHVWLTYTEIQD